LHSFLVNRNKSGSMLLPGDSLFLLETTPAAGALLAANEAEKAAGITLVDCRFMGASGRLYVSGTESAVRAASEAAIHALSGGDDHERR
jgi:microcompartment protein CcmL/EutN